MSERRKTYRTLTAEIASLTTQVKSHNKAIADLCDILKGEDGVLSRLTALETTLKNFKWIFGLGIPTLTTILIYLLRLVP